MNTPPISICRIEHGTPAYKECIRLSEEVLRKPLGLTFSSAELTAEKDYIHMAGMMKGEIVATLAIVPQGEICKMRRVAINPQYRSLGLGSALLRACENVAKTSDFKTIYCHARATAVPFYLKNGYAIEGDYFEEQGIPHVKMWKRL